MTSKVLRIRLKCNLLKIECTRLKGVQIVMSIVEVNTVEDKDKSYYL